MQKEILRLEYPLQASSAEILWRIISTDHGLERWLADRVKEQDGVLSLTWGDPWGDHHTMQARVEERVAQSRIRLRWVDEDDPDAFWQMSIGRSELTGELCLCVVDYAAPDDLDDLRALWDGNLERLHRSTGM